MESPRALVEAGLRRRWLSGIDWAAFEVVWCARTQQLRHTPPGRVLLAESDPARFLACFFALVTNGHSVALGNPRWGVSEWQQAVQIVQPHRIWSDRPLPVQPPPSASHVPTAPVILIATGGSSGHLRFATHTWDTLAASVGGFHRFFGDRPVHACCVLPLFHVSGLMQVMRSLLTGGTLILTEFGAIGEGTAPPSTAQPAFLSLVPTQLQRLLQSPHTQSLLPWLHSFEAILLGGSPPWDTLLATARHHTLPLAPTYGMTETASQIATQRPAAFLNGTEGYEILPHAQVHIQPQADGLSGGITIQATSLALGYYPTLFPKDRSWTTDDLGYLTADGRLRVVGRASDKIITGGENVFPAEVEAAIRATGGVLDVAVIGMGDRQWGEQVVAAYVPAPNAPTPQELDAHLTHYLSPYKRPKQWVALPSLPRNAQGKLNRAQLRALLSAAAQSTL